MRFSDLNTFVTAGYVALGYDENSLDPNVAAPVISPGPATSVELLKLSTTRIVFLTLGGGAGMSTELLYDRIFITARVIGRQEDYADAENMAWQLDTMFCKVDHPTLIGTARTLSIVRAGGAPTLLEKDPSDRYIFTCTYLAETKTGL